MTIVAAPGQDRSRYRFIFGGDKKWDQDQFTAVDDRVRGGASASHLTVEGEDGKSARFHGNLDIKTLGGAGFASQRTVDELFTCPDLRGADALVSEVVVPAAGEKDKTYTLTLKDEVLPRRPDGREQSTVSWEYDFRVTADVGGVGGAAAAATTGPGATSTRRTTTARKIVMPLDEFKPTYRGRPVDDGSARLDLARVKRISFMMRR